MICKKEYLEYDIIGKEESWEKVRDLLSDFFARIIVSNKEYLEEITEGGRCEKESC